MTLGNRSDPQWLEHLLQRGITQGWCMQINCTTCPAEDLREALGLLDKSSLGQPRFLSMTKESAEAIVDGLRACAPKADDYPMEVAARWVLYEVWRSFGDRYFPILDSTWAGDVLVRMRAHNQRRQEARRLQEARQGVKMRDWKE